TAGAGARRIFGGRPLKARIRRRPGGGDCGVGRLAARPAQLRPPRSLGRRQGANSLHDLGQIPALEEMPVPIQRAGRGVRKATGVELEMREWSYLIVTAVEEPDPG